LAAKGYDAVVLDRRRSKLGDERGFDEIPPPRIGPPPPLPQQKPPSKPHTKAPQKPSPRPGGTAPKQKAELPPLPPPTTERSDTFEPPAPPKTATPKPEDLIDAHTSLFNLDEQKLGQRLLDYALENNPDYVQSVLDSVGLFDRDDVSVAFAEAASDEDLRKMAATPEGRRLLARLFDELTEGEVGDDEQKQANRILAIQTKALLSEGQFAEGIERAKERIVLPYRKPGLTVITPSPIYAYRTDKGKIQVRLRTDIYGTEYYEDKDIRLPSRIWQG